MPCRRLWTGCSSTRRGHIARTTNTNWHTVRKYDAKPTKIYPWSSFWTQISPLTLNNVAGRLAAVASKSNGAWQVTLYSYDTHGGIAATHTFTQNDAGNAVLTAINTATLYQRDLRGEITKRSTTVGSSSFNHWYDYNNRGLLEKVFTSTTATKPGSPDVTYTYGADGSPHNGSSYTNSDAHRLNGIAYDLSGNLSALTRYRESASIIDNLSYTTAGSSNRLSSLSDAIGTTAKDWGVQTGSFTYDANGNMTTAPAP